ncbi:glycoside hydrolase family 130 protein [Ignavibacterium sp.]|uniref:glycoside hydrolase family 130 protein n=1 Tax=Ignavibacterium sp. TaxID=2651167 RepID=UPI0022076566|nr:glycoside hydrolase family 130 protein [Ignavibacterium sp.]BDQ04171.1 MAG: glycosidase [Ignavibacterium sp.]
MNLIRKDIILRPDPKRVLFRPFVPKTRKQILKIVARILKLSDEEVNKKYHEVIKEFGNRHNRIDEFFLKQYESVKDLVFTDERLSDIRKLLIGAYFTLEYSFESSALFNPSMIWHPDQSNLPEGSRRFILSLRAIGEGHISSITFRSGIVDNKGNISIDKPTKFVTSADMIPDSYYEKELFSRKLKELNLLNDFSKKILDELNEFFTINELKDILRRMVKSLSYFYQNADLIASKILNLAKSNYEIQFSTNTDISERVIFPSTPNETNGIEDARFCEFKDEDGAITYYATYTAYDGEVVFPQLLETRDFYHFKVNTLNGPAIQNKGMALFPRKINGHYAMLSRQDGENIYIMFSDMIHFWYHKKLLLRPTYHWEFVQIGNSGSPIETDYGWLVLYHGVGAMRKYSLGAFLLDKNDPTKVIARTKEPILTANENEREGYVPNVIYTCGGQIFNGNLIIPYAMSDYASSFAILPLEDLINEMVKV